MWVGIWFISQLEEQVALQGEHVVSKVAFYLGKAVVLGVELSGFI